jgi:heme-binding protein
MAAIRWSATLFLIALAGAQVVRPDRTNPKSDPAASLLRHAPPAVASIIQRSCRDCHSNETTWPWYSNLAPMSWMLASHVTSGRDDFNYSEWSSYNEDDQDKLLGAMCNLAKRGRMPLPSYLVIHRDAKLSAAEVNTLCTWSEKMRDTLQ